MGYIDPNTGAYIGGDITDESDYQEGYELRDPADYDPYNQDTWSGTDPNTGGQWAGIGGPPEDQ